MGYIVKLYFIGGKYFFVDFISDYGIILYKEVNEWRQ
nr:MAG TPA_asm: hypothetical protein [Caudoviricetes sp.]